MRLFGVENWLRSPADRDIITAWTQDGQKGRMPAPPGDAYQIVLPDGFAPDDGSEEWEFVALGDTGDAAAHGPGVSPQDAVAQGLAEDSAPPVGRGRARMVMHTGDVIYMTGEKRLYDRNFRRPYAPFLTGGSTVHELIFKVPFLPVPGNHDYYDLGSWAMWLGRVPVVGAGLRAIAHQLFAFNVPEGGSDMGRAYMEAFVDLGRNGSSQAPLSYDPGRRTRIPNRYYQFRAGNVDFFALDSNTLDAPAPQAGMEQVRRDAAARIAELEEKAREVDRELRRAQLARDEHKRGERERSATDLALVEAIKPHIAGVAALLAGLRSRLEQVGAGPAAVGAIRRAETRWEEGAADLGQATDGAAVVPALDELDDASDAACSALRELDAVLAGLPQDSAERADLLDVRGRIDQALSDFAKTVTPPPDELDARLHALSEEALDVQRELALERRRLRYRPADHDSAQLAWLDAALKRSHAERPDAWRIVWLHHPPYTTIGNHAERPDVYDLRDNLLPILKGRVDAVFSGHSHAFEWFRSDALPDVGFFVSGGGGQISLRPSLMEPRLLRRRRVRYESLRRAGVVECAASGYGPAAEDGEDGPVYHYLRVRVGRDELTVTPVGVRLLRDGGYRREEPIPAFHANALPAEGNPPWRPRRLQSVTVRRGGRGVEAHWAPRRK